MASLVYCVEKFFQAIIKCFLGCPVCGTAGFRCIKKLICNIIKKLPSKRHYFSTTRYFLMLLSFKAGRSINGWGGGIAEEGAIIRMRENHFYIPQSLTKPKKTESCFLVHTHPQPPSQLENYRWQPYQIWHVQKQHYREGILQISSLLVDQVDFCECSPLDHIKNGSFIFFFLEKLP